MKPPPNPKAACSSATEAGGLSHAPEAPQGGPTGGQEGPRLRLVPESIAGTRWRQATLLSTKEFPVNKTNTRH